MGNEPEENLEIIIENEIEEILLSPKNPVWTNLNIRNAQYKISFNTNKELAWKNLSDISKGIVIEFMEYSRINQATKPELKKEKSIEYLINYLEYLEYVKGERYNLINSECFANPNSQYDPFFADYSKKEELVCMPQPETILKYFLNININEKNKEVLFKLLNDPEIDFENSKKAIYMPEELYLPQFGFLNEFLNSLEEEYRDKEEVHKCLLIQVKSYIKNPEQDYTSLDKDEYEYMRKNWLLDKYNRELNLLTGILKTTKNKEIYGILEKIISNETEIDQYSRFFDIIQNKEKIDGNAFSLINGILDVYYDGVPFWPQLTKIWEDEERKKEGKGVIVSRDFKPKEYTKKEYPLILASYGEIEILDELEELLGIEIPGYIPIKKIGEGGIRKVYKVVDKRLNRIRALKLNMPSEDIINERANTILQIYNQEKLHGREVDVLEILNHDNLARIWDWGEHEKKQYISEEYVGGTNLEQKIKNNGPIKTTEEFADIFIPMLKAINHLTNKGYIHRDINPDNILVSENLKTVKLTDLQNAVKTKNNGEYIGKSYGSYRTAAPELLFENRATSMSDYYSIGCCMYFALTGEMLFDKKEVNRGIREKRYIEACGKLDKIKSILVEDDISKKYNLNSSDICEMVKSAISEDEQKRLDIGDEIKKAEVIIKQMKDYYSNIISEED